MEEKMICPDCGKEIPIELKEAWDDGFHAWHSPADHKCEAHSGRYNVEIYLTFEMGVSGKSKGHVRQGVLKEVAKWFAEREEGNYLKEINVVAKELPF